MAAFPGLFSSPGAIWPGSMWPADPGPGRLPVTIGYLGDDARVYPAYRDLSTGLTLSVVPGGFYTFLPASYPQAAADGPPAVPGDGRWTGYGLWTR